MFRPIKMLNTECQKINPSQVNVSPTTKKLLAALIETYPEENFFDALDSDNQPKEYLVRVKTSCNGVDIYERVQLEQSLVRYNRKKNPAEHRYAAYQAKPVGEGTEGAVYLSDGTIKVISGSTVEYKDKTGSVKQRAVKILRQPLNENREPKLRADGSLLDPRKQSDKANREWSFLKALTMFAVKDPVLVDDDSRAALIMRRISGDECFNYLDKDAGGFDSAGDFINGSGDIFNVDQRIDLTILLANAVLAAHEKGIIHRDINAGNLMLLADEEYNPKSAALIDFGLAKWKDEQVGDESKIGSEEYIAPEVKDGAPADERSDTWSLMTSLKKTLWQCIDSDTRYDLLTADQRKCIKGILSLGLEADPGERLALQDIVDLLSAIRDERQQAHRAENSAACKAGM